mgnify:FL=1
MNKGILVAFLAIGFIFAGVISASAATVTWTLVEDAAFAGNSRGAGGLLCKSGTTADNCNFNTAVDCKNSGTPTVGACSFAELNFTMASSCAAGSTGQSCTQNTDCGSPLTPCVPCNPPARQGVTFFGSRTDTSKGAGTYVANACENGYDITKLNIATSEVVTHVGGSCMTLDTFNSSSGCAAGTTAMDYDVKLWTSTIGTCGFPAGTMPGLTLAGRIYAVPTYPAGICGYSTSAIGSIASTVGLGSGDYLSIVCGSGTLPTDLATVCIPGAAWDAVIVASTSSNLASVCPGACGSCMGGTAEGVE